MLSFDARRKSATIDRGGKEGKVGGSQLIYSFRVRLLLVLVLLLVSTLTVQYVLSARAQIRTDEAIATQERALTAGLSLGIESISSSDYLVDLQRERPKSLTEQGAGRISNVLIIDNEERVADSLDPKYNPVQEPDGTTKYMRLTEVPLPPIVKLEGLPADSVHLPAQLFTSKEPSAGDPRAIAIPVATSKGIKHIIVVLGTAPAGRVGEAFLRSVKSLLPTLAVMLAAILVTGLLVWRFTQPINDLSEGARRVAAGDFGFRVPAGRRDEMGALAMRFNQMIDGVSKIREMEARLSRAERAAIVGRLTSAVAHEIKNPLNYINLTIDHLRAQFLPEDPEKRQIFARLTGQIKAEVGRINRRIIEFLGYASPSRLEMKPLNIGAVVEESFGMVKQQAAEQGVKTEIIREGDLPTVAGDMEALRSVFTNLMINALQAFERGEGSLTIKLEVQQETVRIEITDSGRGIPPDHLSQIFEPYFSTKETGTGLGLAIVKKAVEDHGGTVGVESKLGEGTTFTVILPVPSTGLISSLNCNTD